MPQPDAPQEIAGRYRVLERLGAGTFGTVYEALDEQTGRRLALKLLRLGKVAGQDVEALEQQLLIAAQLRHPGIVEIVDAGRDGDRGFVAMELLAGTTLDVMLEREGPLPWPRAANIAAQVAEALDAAHAAGLVHRDVKPANIMVDAEDRAKLADLGLARSFLPASGDRPDRLEGTPPYMSPEQARGQPVDGRSDLFSLGCVLYEMVSGRRAFAADTITALIFEIITAQPPRVREHHPELPPALDGVIAKALAKHANARYARGKELAEELRKLA